MWAAIRRKLWPKARRFGPWDGRTDTAGLEISKLTSIEDFQQWHRESADRRHERRSLEWSLMRTPRDAPFTIPGQCYVCDQSVALSVDYLYSVDEMDGRPIPNWRERLLCPHCGLNNRMRATIHLFETLSFKSLPSPVEESRIYITEQTTPLYAALMSRYPSVVGSEFLGDACPLGEKGPRGWRNEDLTRLTFPDGHFDAIICLDVFEHVPDFRAAFRECHRVLKPGGLLLVTVPFRVDRYENLVRARVEENGEIEHLMEPEYHGDPLSEQGCLAFYHYGWELLDRFRDAGFSSAESYVYWSRDWGYLGAGQTYHLASKSV